MSKIISLNTYYYKKNQIDELLNNKSNVDHTHSQYLTQHQDISGKVDKTGHAPNKNLATNNDGVLITEDKPIIPTKTSDLTNDSGFVTIDNIPELNVSELNIPNKADKTGWIPNKNIVTDSEGELITEDKITKTSQLNNDNGFITINDIPESNNFSGSYNDLTDKPIIPTKTSQLNNDNGFITISSLDDKISKSSTSGLVKNDGTVNTSLNKLNSIIDELKSLGLDLFDYDDTYDLLVYLFYDKLQYNTYDEKVLYTKNGKNYYELATMNDIPSLTNYIQKSNTVGLINNNGTVNTYLNNILHIQDILNQLNLMVTHFNENEGSINILNNQLKYDVNNYTLKYYHYDGDEYDDGSEVATLDDLNDISGTPVQFQITYSDNTTETLNVLTE